LLLLFFANLRVLRVNQQPIRKAAPSGYGTTTVARNRTVNS
jgi:hypothetical protein